MKNGPLLDFFRGRGVPLCEVAPDTATPARFSDGAAEHLATRRTCGLFNFSFMGCVEVSGRDSLAFLHRLQTRNLSRLAEGHLAYTLLLRPDGTVLDDATVWRLGPERYCLFVGRRADVGEVRLLAARYSVSFADRSSDHAIIAVQGRHAWTTIARCLSAVPAAPSYYAFASARFGDAGCKVARLGYCGETGYELIVDVGLGAALWRALLDAGAAYDITECGFDAADSLRIEAGHILFSRELASPVTPYELGFTRLLDFHRDPAVGIAALRTRRWQEPRQRLVGLLIDEIAAPPVATTGDGTLPVEGTARPTSVCRSPLFRRLLGLGFVCPADRYPGTRVKLAGGGRARVARLPFYDPAKFLARRLP
jgi:aminomethyltransferase